MSALRARTRRAASIDESIGGREGLRPRPGDPRKVATIGVVGLSFMGSGIVACALDVGLTVIAVEQNADAAAKGRDRVESLLDRALRSGRIDATGKADRLNRLTVSVNLESLAPADLVIEAVFDDPAVKTELFLGSG